MSSLLIAAIACMAASLPATMNLPLVDPGLFVISDVKTCGNSTGYCLLGNDCTTDDDFLPDPTGNCDGLKGAFTPSASFACCKFNRRSSLSSSSPPPPPPKRFGKPPTSTTVAATVDAAAATAVAAAGKSKEATVPRDARERVDGQTDDDQLAKLDRIGLVVRKIIEQLLNETANVIRPADEQPAVMATAGAATTVEPAAAATAATATTVETAATAKPVDGVDGDSARTEASETDGGTVNQAGTDAPGTDGEASDDGGTEADAAAAAAVDDDDDELRADKRLCRKSCNAADIVFAVDKKPLCYGTLLDENWILTSAACATRLNKVDMRKVVVNRKDWFGPGLSISNLLVHENYKSPASKNSPDNNDLALASLTVPLQEQPCVPCLVQKRNITNEECRSSANTNFKNPAKSENCEGRVQMRKLVNSYLILPCNRWRMQYNQEGRLGSGLWCDGKLAGVQTGVGVGSMIYTPVNEYGEWISDNKRIERRK